MHCASKLIWRCKPSSTRNWNLQIAGKVFLNLSSGYSNGESNKQKLSVRYKISALKCNFLDILYKNDTKGNE